MNAVAAANQRRPLEPIAPQPLGPSPRQSEPELTINIETVHIRAEAVTSVLKDILSNERIFHRQPIIK